ncbi:solute carrier family 28 member 3-like isoform X2 [Rhopilema esculentum]|uniref:solute carrier family 28 member 3-like isoform X2 n=1 Tax=Rhopilema esculentum TaxID=499914 RepID=UPI0031DA1D6A|eukprot:gene17651-9297_t
MSAKKASYNLRGDEDDTDEITSAKKLAQKKISESRIGDVELKDLSNGEKGHEETVVNVPDNGNEEAPAHASGICAPLDKYLSLVENACKSVYEQNTSTVKFIFFTFLFCLTVAYVLAACIKNFDKAVDLFAVAVFALFCVIYTFVKKYFGHWISKNIFDPIIRFVEHRWMFFKWGSLLVFAILLVLWIALDTVKVPSRLVSFVGLIVYIILGFLFSKHRARVIWRPVIWGFGLQFVFGLLILRTEPGRVFFKWLGDRVSIFLQFSDAGAKFIFGDLFMNHFFAFKVLPVVVYFSAFVYMIYYLGIMQVVIKKIAWVMQISMGTSAAESLNAAGNIFIGQTEAPLLIRPFLPDLTKSEMHAVMTGGFATIAGSVLGAYIAYGVSASHLLSASVMSAPAALAISKLMYPETKVPKTKNVDDIHIEKGKEKNFIEALAAGASMSILLVANIAVMLIAFLAMKEFLNAILCWLGGMFGKCVTFELICSYVFMPFAYVMGVAWDDCFVVAELLGIKTFVNEFVAYEKLSELIKNRRQNLSGTKLSLRSEIIATYALCGFANIGSIGVQIGGLSALAPQRRSDLASVAVRAMIAGTIACFMTACIAGILYQDGYDDSTIPVLTTILTPRNFTNFTTARP